MESAINGAITQLRLNGLEQKRGAELIIEMVNYHSRKFDRKARILQSVLFSALQEQLPDSKILLIEESLNG